MRGATLFVVAAVLAGAPALAGSDVEFIQKAASGGMLEVKLGDYAQQHAADPAVRAFGKRMSDDHGKANQELTALAQKEGVEVPAEMSEEHAEMAKKLMSQTGAEFDRNYIAMMVEDHEEDVEAFQAEAKDGKTDVDRWAASTVPTLESHLSMARDLNQRLNAKAQRDVQRTGTSDAPADIDHGRMGPGAARP